MGRCGLLDCLFSHGRAKVRICLLTGLWVRIIRSHTVLLVQVLDLVHVLSLASNGIVVEHVAIGQGS